MITQFFVNHRTRMCQVLAGPPTSAAHLAAVKEAIGDGYVEVSGDEQDAFRVVTRDAKAKGWKPERMRYSTWLKKQVTT